MKKIKKYWWVILFVFGLGTWVTSVEFGLAAGEKKDKSQDEIMEKLADISVKQMALTEKMNGKIDVILQMLGLKVADSTISRWKAMPKAPVLDSIGKPILDAEWLIISDDYLVGHRMKWKEYGEILVRIEWDERKDST